MTKAERIFRETYFRCMLQLERWGAMKNPDGRLIGFSNLVMSDNDCICTRTLNAVQECINSMSKQLDIFAQYEIGKDKDSIRRMSLEMTQVTLENARKNYARQQMYRRLG